jgi:hypothetical protein
MEIYFVFSSPRKKRRKKPHPHCSTFASPTIRRSKPKLAKELQPTEGSSRAPLKIIKMASNFAYAPVLNCYF